jgi:adenylate cyclase
VALRLLGAPDNEASPPDDPHDTTPNFEEIVIVMLDDQPKPDYARELLGRYVSEPVASQALEGASLEGAMVQASAMFVDLCGFTALTRRLPASEVVALLNQYYAIVDDACEGQAGLIAQFLGDGVVAVFGGPLRPVADHARRAVRAAVAVQRALAKRNASDEAERLSAGIGICSGEMIAGNVGAGRRVTYTIVGDAVNQAARLQEKTRGGEASILVTGSTRSAIGSADELSLRSVGMTTLKGVAEPVAVYAVELL